jgi:ABC-type uncharacterized transport system fused permease/ATPase subunit
MASDFEQPLLIDVSPSPRPSQPPANASYEHSSPRTIVVPSQAAVFKFLLLAPLDCSNEIASLLVLLGVGASGGVGIMLAEIGKQLGNLNVSFDRQDVDLFDATVRNVVIYILITVVLQGLATYCMKQIGLMKRIHLNRTLHSDYLRDKKFYVLNAFHSDHCDCVDSRLTSDIETMTTELYSIVQTVVTQSTAFIYSMTLLSNDYIALIALVCLCLFSVLMFGVLQFFLKWASSSVSALKKDEGLFIFQHTRIKKNCESIAFYSGQFLELQKMKLLFDSVLQSSRKVIKSQMILDFLGNLYNTGIGTFFVIWIGKSPIHFLPNFTHPLLTTTQ